MPLFDFYCSNCKTTEEKLIITSNDLQKVQEGLQCTICKSKLIKMPSKFGFDLKGAGWYKSGRKV